MGLVAMEVWQLCLCVLLCLLATPQAARSTTSTAPEILRRIQLSRRLPTIVHRLKEFHHLQQSEKGLHELQVVGNTSTVTSSHPTIQLILQRMQTNSKPSQREDNDTAKVALCIEGGGMRGCVSAGAVATLNFLGLNDAVDVVYGSSAGAMIGAYFVSRQYSGLKIYSDVLPRAGSKFIAISKLLPAVGIPLDVIVARKKFHSISKGILNRWPKQRKGKNSDDQRVQMEEAVSAPPTSVLNLDFLLNGLMKEHEPLDWDTYIHNEARQPLRIIASNAKSLSSIALSFDQGHYHDLDSLLKCIRASMLVPGVTEPLLSLENKTITNIREVNKNLRQNISHAMTSNAKLLLQGMKKLKMPRWNVPQMIRSGTDMTQTAKTAFQDILNSTTSSSKKMINSESIKMFRSLQTWMAKDRSRPVAKPLLRRWNRQHIVDHVSALHTRALKQYSLSKFPTSLKKDRTTFHAKWKHKNHNLMNFNSSFQGTEPNHLCDALLCEPIPYRSAIAEADHMIVLRTKPDPCLVLGKGSNMYDNFIAQRFFKIHGADEAVQWLQDLQHQKIYAEDVLLLNEAAMGPTEGIKIANKHVHLLPIAPIGNVMEISQLEIGRENIIYGLRSGARRVLEIFWPEMVSSDHIHDVFATQSLDKDITIDALLDLIVPPYVPGNAPKQTSSHAKLHSSATNKGIKL